MFGVVEPGFCGIPAERKAMTKENSSRSEQPSGELLQRRILLKSVAGAMASLVVGGWCRQDGIRHDTRCTTKETCCAEERGHSHRFRAPINEGMLIFDQGKIVEVGANLGIPENAEVIDLKGREVWPSMIEANSQLGLTEIASVRATIDYAETGLLNPNVSAHVAVNPDSELIPVTRANGVLIA